MAITVVIPAYNEEQYISNCLDSLANQITDLPFEVIVVNNNSTDRSQEIINNYKNKLNLRIILETKKGRGAARWRGFKEAKGDIILSTDADSVVPLNWIQALTNSLKNSSGVAVSGPCYFDDMPNITKKLMNILQPLFMVGYRIIFGHYFLSGFNFAIQKTAYIQSGGFNPNLNAIEDGDLSFRVNKIGKIKFVPKIKVIASGRRFKSNLIGGLISYIATFINYYLFHINLNKSVYMNDVR